MSYPKSDLSQSDSSTNRYSITQPLPAALTTISPLSTPVSQAHLLGGMHINYIMLVFIPLIIAACLFCYHTAVSTHQERPFPHATITHTACHYPQDIVFRMFTLQAGSFVFLLYFTLFRFLRLEQQHTQFPFSTEQWIYPIAQTSIIGFYGAVGTIDGAGYPIIHLIGSIFFFILLYVVAGAGTIVLGQMHNWNSTVITSSSLTLKRLIVGYLSAVAIYCILGLTGILQDNQNDNEKEDNVYVVILEWNLAIAGLVWLLTFVLEWKNVFVTLRGPSDSLKRITE